LLFIVLMISVHSFCFAWLEFERSAFHLFCLSTNAHEHVCFIDLQHSELVNGEWVITIGQTVGAMKRKLLPEIRAYTKQPDLQLDR
jgi:hypothetical protein